MKVLAAALLVTGAASAVPFHTFASSDGHRIAYTVQGAGPAMAVLPGGPGLDGAYMRIGVRGLHARSYVIDPRGTGASRMPETTRNITVAAMLDDLERLRASLRLQRWIVMGHSFGGYLAQAYAARYPEHVRALVLVSSSAPDLSLESQVQQQFYGQLSAQDRATLAGLRNLQRTDPDRAMQTQMDTLLPYFFAGRSNWPKVKPYMDPPHNSYAMARALYSDLGAVHNAGSLRALKAPVLVLYGEKDGGVDVFSRAILDNTRNAHLAVVRGAGHFVWVEQPAVFRDTVNAFLAQVR